MAKVYPKNSETTKNNYRKQITKNKYCAKSADADALFEKLWRLYPNKRGKGQVSKTQKQKLFEIGYDEMLRAIDRYKVGLEQEPWRKPQNGSTFFNSGFIDYLDRNYDNTRGSEVVGNDDQSRGTAADFYEQFMGISDSD